MKKLHGERNSPSRLHYRSMKSIQKKTAYVASTMQHSVEYHKIQFIIIAKLITKTVSQIKILVKKIYEFQQV